MRNKNTRKFSTAGLDKMTIRIDREYINTEMKRHFFYEGNDDLVYNPGVTGINVINHNSNYYINFHDCLFRDPNVNMFNVVKEGLLKLFFHENQFLLKYPDNSFICNCCHLAEIEVFYDFYNFEATCKFPSSRWNVQYETTYYSDDYIVKYKKHGHEKFWSLICIYDRGLKLRSRDKIERIEFRFKKNYIKPYRMDMLNQTFEDLYVNELFRRIVRYTDKFMNPSMIQFNYQELINTHSPFLFVLRKTKNFKYFC